MDVLTVSSNNPITAQEPGIKVGGLLAVVLVLNC